MRSVVRVVEIWILGPSVCDADKYKLKRIIKTAADNVIVSIVKTCTCDNTNAYKLHFKTARLHF